MKGTAQEVLGYFQENLVATLVIALIAGFLAGKTVAYGGKRRGLVFFFAVGLLGSFLGQFAVLYFGLKEVLEQIPEFRLVFDLLAAYVGSFILASMIHFLKPL
ncbi:MAG: hypothetical protein ACE5JU_10110 [Candidatus Binatia bacterium]